MDRAETLEHLARLCRSGRDTSAMPMSQPSGWSALDDVLPGGGWPGGVIVELMPMATGIGELRFVLPTLARLSRAEQYVALVSPPHIPFAPALVQHGIVLERLVVIDARANEDTLWAFEQTLRCKSFGAVLAWCSTAKDREVRRLQLAAESSGSVGFLYRPPSAAIEPSPAAIRLRLQAHDQGLLVNVLKCRGARSGMTVTINADNRASESAGDHSLQPAVHSL
jgi:hypothetical protein